MVQKLVVYPDQRIYHTSTDVRTFNQTLWDVIEDMQDTMEANNLDALAAIQIAYPYNIILMKQADGTLKEYINPRIIGHYGSFESEESTLYYPKITLTVSRVPNIKVVYEDRYGNSCAEDIDNKAYAATFQRKIDYTFGGTLLDKLPKVQQEAVLESLHKSGVAPAVEEVCPSFSRKDYFISFTDKLLFFMFFSLFTPFLGFEAETIATFYKIDTFLFPTILLLMVAFFFYAQHEAKEYRQCSSCQIGHNIGVIAKRVGVGVLFFIGAFFLLR
jgi:peptide deformylase